MPHLASEHDKQTVPVQAGVEIWPWIEPPEASRMSDAASSRKGEYIWYFIVLANTLLVLRIFTLLLGWQDFSPIHMLVMATNPLVMMFRGVFDSPSVGSAMLDSSAITALAVYTAVGWMVASRLALLSARRLPV